MTRATRASTSENASVEQISSKFLQRSLHQVHLKREYLTINQRRKNFGSTLPLLLIIKTVIGDYWNVSFEMNHVDC